MNATFVTWPVTLHSQRCPFTALLRAAEVRAQLQHYGFPPLLDDKTGVLAPLLAKTPPPAVDLRTGRIVQW